MEGLIHPANQMELCQVLEPRPTRYLCRHGNAYLVFVELIIGVSLPMWAFELREGEGSVW